MKKLDIIQIKSWSEEEQISTKFISVAEEMEFDQLFVATVFNKRVFQVMFNIQIQESGDDTTSLVDLDLEDNEELEFFVTNITKNSSLLTSEVVNRLLESPPRILSYVRNSLVLNKISLPSKLNKQGLENGGGYEKRGILKTIANITNAGTPSALSTGLLVGYGWNGWSNYYSSRRNRGRWSCLICSND
jgi:hypothetical protein